jgi:hypothetical protein
MVSYIIENIIIVLPIVSAFIAASVKLRLSDQGAYMRLKWVIAILAGLLYLGKLSLFIGGTQASTREIQRLATSHIEFISESIDTEDQLNVTLNEYRLPTIISELDRVRSSAEEIHSGVTFLFEFLILSFVVWTVFHLIEFIFPMNRSIDHASKSDDSNQS